MKKIFFAFLTLLTANTLTLTAAETLVKQEQYQENRASMHADVKNIAREFNLLFPGPYSIGEHDSQIKEKKIPQLLSNGEVLNNNAKVTTFADKNKAHVAVLVRDDADYYIIASNMKKANDISVDGLKLDRENTVYKNLKDDLGFNGKVTLWGKEYQAKVDPLKNKKGTVVGALLVALPHNS